MSVHQQKQTTKNVNTIKSKNLLKADLMSTSLRMSFPQTRLLDKQAADRTFRSGQHFTLDQRVWVT